MATDDATGQAGPSTAPARYEAAARRALAADHRLAAGLSRVLARPRTARGAIRLVGQFGWTRRQFARWMFEDYPRALLATPGRWQRGAVSGDGAYAAR